MEQVQNVENQQPVRSSVFTVAIIIVSCIAIFAVLVLAIIFLGKTYAKTSEAVIYEVVNAGLKRNVRQIVVDIEMYKHEEIQKMERHISSFCYEIRHSDKSVSALLSEFMLDSWKSLGFRFVVWNENDDVLFSDIKDVKFTSSSIPNGLVEKFALYKVLKAKEGSILCYITMEEIDNRAKDFIYKKIHSTYYDDESYMWINEVVNYEGGEGYAVRRIHPNLKNTEGMLLSTSMQDVAGGYPYLEELNGINKDGEILYSYYFKLLKEDRPALKRTYAFLYKPYNWIICMGTYIKYIKNYTDEIRHTIFKLSAISIVVVAAILLFIILIILKQSKNTALGIAKLESERKLNKAKEAIFSSMSHDMRTPLNAVIGFSDLASREETSQKVKDYLHKINISGRVLMNLINDTLIIGRIHDGTHISNNILFRSFELAKECIVVAQASAERKGVRLVVNIPEKSETFYGDRNAIQKVFFNLVSNAIKYTPEGGTVTIRLIVEDEKNKKKAPVYEVDPIYANDIAGFSNTYFFVEDTGIGMSSEFIEHMFEPFSQEDPASAINYGVGLGLAIVKRLVDIMGGTIEVKSNKGMGSSFRVNIPLWRLKESAFEKEQANLSEKKETDSVLSKNIKVLVCEDNELNKELLTEILNQRDINVIPAENGKDGCSIFEKSAINEFNAILMDLRMPVMDGFEATKTIRSMNRADALTIPIIAISADAFEEDKVKSMNAGVNAHIAKPINADKLISILMTYINKG